MEEKDNEDENEGREKRPIFDPPIFGGMEPLCIGVDAASNALRLVENPPATPTTMKSILRIGAALAAVCLLAAAAVAVDPSGTWVSDEGKSAEGRGPTLVFAVKDGQLSGTFQAPGQRGRPTKISAASISGDTIRFTVERTVQKMKVVTKYSGKLKGDTITGKVEGPAGAGGQPGARDWIARRSK